MLLLINGYDLDYLSDPRGCSRGGQRNTLVLVLHLLRKFPQVLASLDLQNLPTN